MGDINFTFDNEKFFVVINNKTYYGAHPVLCTKALEEWECSPLCAISENVENLPNLSL